ncbi:glycosyltransferase family 39 protein [Nonomuraea sp. NPDC000554]|uniref:glycosyltransferase family 39 protein n=1 Tax=Nonomuraea sp. NPDC000554 TaxID=3154259 RepID=UPI0033329F79
MPDASALVIVGPAVIAAALGLWRIDGPSYWADEGVSVAIASRPLADLPTILAHMDLAHGLYYVLLHFVSTVAGTSEFAMRLPSVLATAAATAVLAALGRRLVSPATGLFAGLIYALLPVVSRYAQEARQYALVTALVIGVTYLLVVTIDAGRDRRYRWRPWAAYTIMLAVAGWLHLYALFILPVHAVILLWGKAPAAGWRHWIVSAGVAGMLVAPLALAARTQFALVSWIPRPDLGTVRHLGWLVFGGNPVAIVTVLALAVVGMSWRRHSDGPQARTIRSGMTGPSTAGIVPDSRRSGVATLDVAAPDVAVTPRAPARLTVRTVALPWLLVPGGLMVVISLIGPPIFYPRYVLHSVAALALAAGAGIAYAVSWAAPRLPAARLVIPAAALAVLAAFTGPAQVAIRQPLSRPDNLRALAHTLRDNARPDDAVLYVPAGNWMSTLSYPDSVARLDTRSLNADGFFGELLPEQLHRAAGRLARIWVVEGETSYGNGVRMRDDPRFRRSAHWSFGTRQLSLYERVPLNGNGRSMTSNGIRR